MTVLELDTRPAQRAYEKADRAVAHYCRLLAGQGLTPNDKLFARIELIRAVFDRGRAERILEETENASRI